MEGCDTNNKEEKDAKQQRKERARIEASGGLPIALLCSALLMEDFDDSAAQRVADSSYHGPTLSYVSEECVESGFRLVHTHRIIVKRKHGSFFGNFLLFSLCLFSILVLGRGGMEALLPLPVLGACLFYLAMRRRVVQEAVVVMPTLGVQLQTFYHSKKVSNRFVPLDKILAPVVNEAVTPVTCYFYLALLLRGEDNLTLAFLHLRPPLRMLVPIWKSICDAVGNKMGTISTGQDLQSGS